MTYTLIARCPRTGKLGVGITTYSLAVGGYCPLIRGRLGAVSTQAFVNLKLGRLALNLLAQGFAPAKTMAELAADDPKFDYRQVGILDADGIAVVHTGPKTQPWSDHVIGPGFLAMGNVLAGEKVVQSMAEAFDAGEAEGLAERLLRGLEAGRDAGGQQSADGAHLTERSAALIVHSNRDYGELDLRVDARPEAVDEIRRLYAFYRPYVPYYELRHRSPDKTPPQADWVRDNDAEI